MTLRPQITASALTNVLNTLNVELGASGRRAADNDFACNRISDVVCTFVNNFLPRAHNHSITLIPGGKGTGRTTLLRALMEEVAEVASQPDDEEICDVDEYKPHPLRHARSLYLSDAIAYDATDPRLSFGDSSFIKLQYRVLHAATGAPPHTFGRTVLALRRQLGLEAWFAFPNDVLFAAVRDARAIHTESALIIAVDEVHVSGQPRYPIYLPPTAEQCPDTTNTVEDLRRLCCYDTSVDENDNARGRNLIVAVARSNFYVKTVQPKDRRRAHLLAIPPPDPNPRIDAACEILSLDPDSQRAHEVQFMLRHAAVNARFLADTYHLICGGGLTSVADFDAQFNAFVSTRIDQFLTYCREKHLDPKHLFDVIFVAMPGLNIIDPLTVAADSIGLCTIVVSYEKSLSSASKDQRKRQNIYLSIHPKVFAMLHSAVFAGTTPNLHELPSSVSLKSPPLLLALFTLVQRINAFSALETTAAPDALAAAPLSSPARCPLHFRSDVALLMLTACLARAADNAPFSPRRQTLTDLIPDFTLRFLDDTQNHIGVEHVTTSYDAKPTPARSEPLYMEGLPRAVYSFPRFDDTCGLLSDPSAAPALLRSMAAHGLIRGALHGLDVVDVNRHVRGSLTLGLQAIDAASEVKRTAAAIAEHRARRAEWAKSFNEQGQNANSPEKATATAGFLQTNIFVHVFVVNVSVDVPRVCSLQFTTEPFTLGGVQCFEVVISMADLHEQWPMAARIPFNEEFGVTQRLIIFYFYLIFFLIKLLLLSFNSSDFYVFTSLSPESKC